MIKGRKMTRLCVLVFGILLTIGLGTAFSEESIVEMTAGRFHKDIYYRIYQGTIASETPEEAKSYLPVSKKINKIMKKFGDAYDHPAFLFMGVEGARKQKAKPKIYRWNKIKSKYDEACKLPIDENIVIVHDPDRIGIHALGKDCRGDKFYGKYIKLSFSVNNAKDNGTPVIYSEWDTEKEVSLNTTYKHINYDHSDSKDKRNKHIVQFPVVKIPRQIKISGEGETYFKDVRYITLKASTELGNVVFPDGTTHPMMEADPGPNSPFCIPVDGYSVTDCYNSPFMLAEVVGEDCECEKDSE